MAIRFRQNEILQQTTLKLCPHFSIDQIIFFTISTDRLSYNVKLKQIFTTLTTFGTKFHQEFSISCIKKVNSYPLDLYTINLLHWVMKFTDNFDMVLLILGIILHRRSLSTFTSHLLDSVKWESVIIWLPANICIQKSRPTPNK